MIKFLNSFFQNFRRLSVKKAFTLAEVLITIGIIGIVAQMTIPALVVSVQRKDTYTALQKALSELNQAATIIRQNNGGDFTDVVASGGTQNQDYANLFAAQLNVVKQCSSAADPTNCYLGTSDGVWNLKLDHYYGAGPNSFSACPILVTADGFAYVFNTWDTHCNALSYQRNSVPEMCLQINVDINGTKPPNSVGRDIFFISVNKFNVTPFWDMNYYNNGAHPDNAYCDMTNAGQQWGGADCAHRVIEQRGITYY